MVIACYIIFSAKIDRFYIGMTQESFDVRLQKHNNGFYEKRFTSQTKDWGKFLIIECGNIEQALKIEKHIKKMKSKSYILNLKKYPEMIVKLQLQYI